VNNGQIYVWRNGLLRLQGTLLGSSALYTLEPTLRVGLDGQLLKSPTQIGSSSWVALRMDTNGQIMSAQSPDYKIWTWGNNINNNLGNSPNAYNGVNRSSPVQIGGSQIFLDWTVSQHAAGGVTKLPE
jgi:hypothetical protein